MSRSPERQPVVLDHKQALLRAKESTEGIAEGYPVYVWPGGNHKELVQEVDVYKSNWHSVLQLSRYDYLLAPSRCNANHRVMDFPRLCPARWLSGEYFGTGMPPHDFLYPFYDMHSNYIRPWKSYNQNIFKESGSTIENEKSNYKISLDVQHFRPNDISVKVTENEIIVEGKHEERPDTHGFISRQFKRRYALPRHCPPAQVTSTMSSDGILTIIAVKNSSNDMEKIVPIKMCGALSKKAHIENKITTEITQNTKENMKATEDTSNENKSQKLLKEEHSRLLKPELLKDAISESNGEMSSKRVTDIMGISEKGDAKNTSGTSNITDKTLAKSSLESSNITEQLGQSLASEMCTMKGISNLSKTLIEESSSSYKSSSTSMSSTVKTSGNIGECVNETISAKLKEAAENV